MASCPSNALKQIMKHIFTLLLILIGCLTSSMAQSEIDSLETLLKKDIHDTLKINILVKLENRYSRVNLDKSIEYGEKFLKLSQQLNDTKHITVAHKLIGINYMKKNYSLDTVLVPFQKAIAVAEKYNHQRDKYGALSGVAMVYRKFGQRDTAFALLQETLTVAEKNGWKKMQSTVLVNAAIILKYQQKRKKAKEYYIKGLNIARELNDQRVVAIASNNLAAVYASDNQLDSALIDKINDK